MSEEAPQGGPTPEQPAEASTPATPEATGPATPAPAPAESAPAPTPAPESQPPASTDPAAVAEAIAGAPPDPAPPAPAPAAEASPAAAPEAAADDPFAGIDQASIDELLKQASFDDPTVAAGPANVDSAAGIAAGLEAAVAGTAVDELPETAPMDLPNFQQVMQDAQVSSIDLLRDVDLNVKIELGRSRMLVEDVLKLAEGSVVELDKLAGDPVDVFVNDRLVARGEVLVLNDNFCVRVNEIVAGAKDEGL
jgi:flagellar motor switch protein FliN/FliY